MNYGTALFSLAVLATATVGIATAQTAAPAPAASDAMHGMSNDSMKGDNMHGMSGGSMQGGGMGMMGMMMGKDPVGSCASMMSKVAADPNLHKKMNAIMSDAMSGKK